MARKKGRKGKKTASEMLESERRRVAKAVGRPLVYLRRGDG